MSPSASGSAILLDPGGSALLPGEGRPKFDGRPGAGDGGSASGRKGSPGGLITGGGAGR